MCHVLTIRNKTKTYTTWEHLLGVSHLSNVSIITDLGINIDSNLSFKSHINTVIIKSLQHVDNFLEGFLLTLRVRKTLGQNSNIWNPTHEYLFDKIENVQCQFTKRITSISHLTYHERLSILDMESLELRRLRFDLIRYYKIINNLIPLKHAQFHVSSTVFFLS